MRQIFILTICLSTIFQAFATRISEDSAFQKALEFAAGRTVKNINSATDPKRVVGSATSKNYYVFNIGEDDGFVIISGDDRTRPVLGYSDTGSFNLKKIPVGLINLLENYDSTIQSLGLEGEIQTAVDSWYSKQHDAIEPLINTTWGQQTPYNDNCPMDGDRKCYTGCVATAMAQIMNYHKWPDNSLPAIAGYYTNTKEIPVNGLTQIDFDWTDLTDASIAKLMRYCGQSVKMNYTQYASSAYLDDAGRAFSDIFGYSKSTVTLYRQYHSDNEWMDLLYENLQLGLPVLYSGKSEQSAHAFIVDGYENGLFHINWGWEGSCDGYFLLDILDPSGKEFYSKNAYAWKQGMVINIYPANVAEHPENSKLIVHSVYCDTPFLERENKDAIFPNFKMKARILGELDQNTEFTTAFALFDDKILLRVLAIEEPFEVYAVDDYEDELEIQITPDVPVGNYRICAVYRKNEEDEWQLMDNSLSRYLSAEIGEKTLWLQPMPKDDTNTVKNIDFGTETIDGINYRLVSEYGNFRAYIEKVNDGNNYSGDIFIPDYVEYLNMDFKVFGESDDAPFATCTDITSISTPIPLSISTNQRIRDYELREGALYSSDIRECRNLERIKLPSTCAFYGTINDCPALKEIHIANQYPIQLHLNQDRSLWTDSSLPTLTDVYFSGDVAPSFMNDFIPTPNTKVNIHIPAGTKNLYAASGWEGWNLEEDLESPSEYIRWDYCGFDTDCNDGVTAEVGENNAEFAIRIPEEMLQAYKNNHITAIEYFTPKELINDKRDCDVEYVFLTKEEEDYIIKKNSTTIRGAWTRIDFDKPIEITGEGLFIGVGRYGRLETHWANTNEFEDGFWHRVMGTDLAVANVGVWERYAGLDDCPFPLAIRAIIEGDQLPMDAMIIKAEYEDNSETSNGIVKLDLLNRSNELISNITFGIKIDGEDKDPISIEASVGPNCTTTVRFRLNGVKTHGDHIAEISILKLNEKSDDIPDNSDVSLAFKGLPVASYPRISVVETVVGTKSGMSPRGIVGMQYMEENHPGRVIPVAIHVDQMAIEDEENSYSKILEEISTTPTAILNRKELNSTTLLFTLDDKEVTDLSISTEASFGKEGGIDIQTISTFALDRKNEDSYRIVNLLLEDNVGPHTQANAFSNPNYQDNPNEIMNWWIHQDSQVEYTYDNVARGNYSFEGSATGIPSEIVGEEEYDSSFNISLPKNIQNFGKLKVVSLLTDSETGEILNADVSFVTGPLPYSGDSNGNGDINVADASNVVNYVVGKETTDFYKDAADVNKDSRVSISDATATIALLLEPVVETEIEENVKKSPSLCNGSDYLMISELHKDYKDGEYVFDVSLSETSTDFVALQADVIIPKGSVIEEVELCASVSKTHRIITRMVDANRLRIVLFDMKGRIIECKEESMIRLTVRSGTESLKENSVRLEHIIAADASANEYRLLSERGDTSENVSTEGYSLIKVSVDRTSGKVVIYNAAEQSMNIYSPDGKLYGAYKCVTNEESIELNSGIYVITIGNFASKVIIP